ncbi:hypothetical protein TNCV_2132361 [Trichonephila clavipes]|nr:hypothetical protein TNCV_2132361 [Trichonephila clavipes]
MYHRAEQGIIERGNVWGIWLGLPNGLFLSRERQCFQTTICMQDGGTSHIGRQVKARLSANFGDNRDYPDIFRMHGLPTHPT